ncbi:hypothetical protein [Legionella nagasakiensis]|uniref:hypothetical protein n=1 Tax=Legionella nagasakiensis TaxID=535290 RepID=UPI0010545A82|nr:hypothetical protein [Legionella nagasakiensis]
MQQKAENLPKGSSVLSLDELLGDDIDKSSIELLCSQAVSAMRLLMFHKQAQYTTKISDLAKTSADLMKQGTALTTVINKIETSIANAHEQALGLLAREIGMADFQLKRTKIDTVPGQALRSHVNAMKAYAKASLSEIQNAIITDTLVQASKLGADLEGFDFINYRPTPS